MNAISFSLWGRNPVYLDGALRNAEIAALKYPNWKCLFYITHTVPEFYTARLQDYENVIIIQTNSPYGDSDSRNMFWRFLAINNTSYERVIIRDTDSPITDREVQAVEQWIISDLDVHLMRDHPYHCTLVMGGMWGAKTGKLKGLGDKIKAFNSPPTKGQDQLFLREFLIFNVLENDITLLTHDEFFDGLNFPSKRSDNAEDKFYVPSHFGPDLENNNTVCKFQKIVQEKKMSLIELNTAWRKNRFQFENTGLDNNSELCAYFNTYNQMIEKLRLDLNRIRHQGQ